MLIAIAIAEEIQGLQRIALIFWVFFDFGKKFFKKAEKYKRILELERFSCISCVVCKNCTFSKSLNCIIFYATYKMHENLSSSSIPSKFLSFLRNSEAFCKAKKNSEAQNLHNFNTILCNPLISSALAMAMSIYRTLCVLVQLRSLFFFPENFIS